MKVLCLGSICLDIVVQNILELPKPNHVTQVDGIKLFAGGGALNTAIALRRLGIDAYPMGEIGKDHAGQILLNIMEEENIKTDFVLERDHKQTSVVNVMLSPEGERSFICNPGNYIKITLDDYDWDNILKDFDYLQIGSCFILDNLLPYFPKILKKCNEHNVTSIIDTVWPTRPTYKLIVQALPYLDYFTPSFEEAQIITGQKDPEDIAKWCLDLGSKNIIIKMDKRGCFVANEKIQEQLPALKVDLKDSTGAGDCFLAGFITALGKDYNLKNAAKVGNSAGAMCVKSLGAYTGITNYDDLVNNYYSQYN